MLPPEFLELLKTLPAAELVMMMDEAGRFQDHETLQAVRDELAQRKPSRSTAKEE